MLAGLLALASADLPFRIPDLIIRFSFPNDRFTLPMMSGAALLIVGLVYALVRRPAARTALLAVLVGLGVGYQFSVADDYRQDWKYQQAMYWQLQWRAPSITPGTAIISPELPLTYETDISLTAPLNWLYAPGDDNQRLPYLWAYIPQRLGGVIPDLIPDQTIAKDYLSSAFVGSTSQVLAVYYQPPACLRILDPVYDADFPGLGGELRRATAISNPAAWVQPDTGPVPERLVFGDEPDQEIWCYYLQKADLARQLGDWETVAALGDTAFALDDSPNHATERLPFIEAYARLGQFKKAERLTLETYKINPRTAEMLCAAWGRVAATGVLADDAAVLADINAALGCAVDSQP